jgi:hypothetical protein
MDHDLSQRAVLGLLLEKHPAMVSVEELRRHMANVPRVDEALEHLLRDGVATKLGDLVGASRVAIRTDQLAL